jgi:hypothetical protein
VPSAFLGVGALHGIHACCQNKHHERLPWSGCLPGRHTLPHYDLFVFSYVVQLMAKAELTLEASYYNLSHDAWEPILEPVVDPNDESIYTPWTLQAEVV